MTAACEDCARPYGDEHGFPDLVVAHDVWERLMPGREGGGLLCPSCMCLRAHTLGIEAEAVFRSGPFCVTAELDSLRAENQRLEAAAAEMPCLGECFGPNGTPETWAQMVAALRAENTQLRAAACPAPAMHARAVERQLAEIDALYNAAGVSAVSQEGPDREFVIGKLREHIVCDLGEGDHGHTACWVASLAIAAIQADQ